MAKVDLSIIIPVYNAEKTIAKCLDSILSQSVKDIELLVINDGSTDSSKKICEEYASKDERIRFFSLENGGVCRARNVGIDNATGRWVTFIDSDDYVEPGYLSIDFDSNAELQLQNWRVWGGGIMPLEDLESGTVDEDNLADFCRDHLQYEAFRMCCCKFYLREILNKHNIRFLPAVKLGEDTLLMLEYLLNVKSIKIIDSGHYMYWRPKNWGTKYTWTVYDAIKYMECFYQRYSRLSFPAEKLLDFMFTGQYRPVIERGLKTRFYWYSAPVNLKIQKLLFKKKGFKYRLRFFLCMVFSFCRVFIKNA